MKKPINSRISHVWPHTEALKADFQCRADGTRDYHSLKFEKREEMMKISVGAFLNVNWQ